MQDERSSSNDLHLTDSTLNGFDLNPTLKVETAWPPLFLYFFSNSTMTLRASSIVLSLHFFYSF